MYVSCVGQLVAAGLVARGYNRGLAPGTQSKPNP